MLNLTSSLLCLTFISIFRVIESEAPDNDLFSSTAEIEKLFVRERDFVALLEAYKNDKEKAIKQLKFRLSQMR